MSNVHTFYWHNGTAYTERGGRLNECTWEEAQEICAVVAEMTGLFAGSTARILKMPPPRVR